MGTIWSSYTTCGVLFDLVLTASTACCGACHAHDQRRNLALLGRGSRGRNGRVVQCVASAFECHFTTGLWWMQDLLFMLVQLSQGRQAITAQVMACCHAVRCLHHTRNLLCTAACCCLPYNSAGCQAAAFSVSTTVLPLLQCCIQKKALGCLGVVCSMANLMLAGCMRAFPLHHLSWYYLCSCVSARVREGGWVCV